MLLRHALAGGKTPAHRVSCYFWTTPKDSIHLSCAIEAGSSIFFTTDTGILKKADLISDLALINPVDYEFNKP